MSVDFNLEELKRIILNLSETRAQLESKACAYANSVKTTKVGQTIKKRPTMYVRVCAWLDDLKSDSSEEDNGNDKQSDVEEISAPRRRARRIKLNWDPDKDKGGGNSESGAEGTPVPIITRFSGNSRRMLMK